MHEVRTPIDPAGAIPTCPTLVLPYHFKEIRYSNFYTTIQLLDTV